MPKANVNLDQSYSRDAGTYRVVREEQNHTRISSGTRRSASGTRRPSTPRELREHFVEAPFSDDSHGVALKAAKDKWNELGPLRLEDIIAHSKEPIDQTLPFG